MMITVWSLVDNSSVFLESPKFPKAGMAFSHDGRFLAVASRRDCKDAVCVYSTATWEQVCRFHTDTNDLADLYWSPDDAAILVKDDPLEYKLIVYRMDGAVVSVFSAYEDALGIKRVCFSNKGDFLAVSSYDEQVRLLSTLTWTPVATYPVNRTDCQVKPPVAGHDPAAAAGAGAGAGADAGVGSSDSVAARVPDLLRASVTSATPRSASSKHVFTVDGAAVAAFMEVLDDPVSGASRQPLQDASSAANRRAGRSAGAGAGASTTKPRAKPAATARVVSRRAGATGRGSSAAVDAPTHFEVAAGAMQVPCNAPPKPSEAASPPAMGVSLMKWSAGDDYLAVKADDMPRVLWVFESSGFRLASVVVFVNPVRSFAWDPACARLAVVTGTSKMYTWEPSGVSFVTIDEDFAAAAVRWSPSGHAVLVLQRGQWRVGLLG